MNPKRSSQPQYSGKKPANLANILRLSYFENSNFWCCTSKPRLALDI